MSDVIDQAQRFETFRREIALAPVLAEARQLATPRTSWDCEDCADPIEPERLAAVPGAARCILCQEAWERLRRQSRV